MRTIRDTLEKLSEITGEKLGDKELKRAGEIAEAVGMSDSDPFLRLALAIEWYWNKLGGIPGRIEPLAGRMEKALEKTRGMWGGILAAVLAAAIVVSAAASWYAYDRGHDEGFINGRNKGWSEGYDRGKTDGVNAGRVEARNEELLLKQRDAFTTTPEFDRAFKMYQSGDLGRLFDALGKAEMAWAIRRYNDGTLKSLSDCANPGWQKDGAMCYPHSTREGVYGWRLN